jgi:hypothetical protein
MTTEDGKEDRKPLTLNTNSPYYYLGVLLVAFIIFGVSFWRVQSNIKAPFYTYNGENETTATDDDLEALKKIDTDGDGLSDYLEAYVYGTSIYIEDTDSDGISDKEEVLSGQDPVCSGDSCVESLDVVAVDEIVDSGLNTKSETEIMRTALLNLGYQESDLAELSDDEIAQLYNETSQLVSDPAALQEYMANNLQDLSAADVRSLLLEAGASEEDLQDISDDELIQLYRQALSSQAE